MEEVLDKHKQNPDHMVFVAKVDDLVVGYLLSVTNNMLFGQCKSFMVIEDVVVNEHMRNQGIGKALMDHAESYAKQNNCSYIMLITDIDRKESQRFYKSIGYKTSEYCAFKKHLWSIINCRS